MKIQGFAKMTLLDYPSKVACTVFTAGCNFLCPFCHNALLVNESGEENYATEEILAFLEKRKGLLDGVCISGGEPLLQQGIEEFIEQIKNMGYSVKLDTNGSFPEKLIAIVEKGLVDYVAMDVKNCIEKYPLSVGIDNFDTKTIEKSIDFLLEGKVDYEFRTTIVEQHHNIQDIEALAKRIKGAKRYFLQKFVDSGALLGEGLTAHNNETMEEMRRTAAAFVTDAQLRGV